MVDVDDQLEIVGITVSGRIVAYQMSFLVLLLFLGLVLNDVFPAARDLAEGKHVRIAVSPLVRVRHDEPLLIFVQNELAVLSEGPGRIEVRHFQFIFFSVSQLLLYLSHSALSSVAEPGGKLISAVLAKISVFKLSVSEKPYLFSAYAAEFLFKKSHIYLLMIKAITFSYMIISCFNIKQKIFLSRGLLLADEDHISSSNSISAEGYLLFSLYTCLKPSFLYSPSAGASLLLV